MTADRRATTPTVIFASDGGSGLASHPHRKPSRRVWLSGSACRAVILGVVAWAPHGDRAARVRACGADEGQAVRLDRCQMRENDNETGKGDSACPHPRAKTGRSDGRGGRHAFVKTRFLNTSRPKSPEPRRTKVPGSGTAEGPMGTILPFTNTKPPSRPGPLLGGGEAMLTVLSSIVTAPFSAMARPLSMFAPVLRVMLACAGYCPRTPWSSRGSPSCRPARTGRRRNPHSTRR